MGIKQLPSGRFRLQVRRKTLKVDEVFNTQAEAEAACRRYMGGATSERVRKTRGITVGEAWTLYLESRVFSEKKTNTRHSEASHVQPVLMALGSRTVKSLTADDVDSFIMAQNRAGKAPDTVRNAVAALSSILNFCRSRNIVPANVTIGVKRPAAAPTVKRMPPGHQGALMKMLDPDKYRYRYRAVARLALLVRETGARPGEWAQAQWDDVSSDKRSITFKSTKYKGMPRTVPLTLEAQTLLTEQEYDVQIREYDKFSASIWIFPTLSRKGGLTHIAYSGTLRDMKKGGLLPKELRAHNGRHEYITNLVENSDLDDSRIMSLVGHHSPISMQIYTHARNLRFLPQLEASSASQRKERAVALAKALGVPTEVVLSYLTHIRNVEKADSLEDAGEELLYQAESIHKLSQVATRLGSNEGERLKTLLKLHRLSNKAPDINKTTKD